MKIEGEDVARYDQGAIEVFLTDLGKWESLVKAGLNLISELRIVQETTLQHYQKQFEEKSIE